MAETAVFSLASKILSTIAPLAFDKVYERGISIWEARDELAKLRETIETIQAVLLDAERKQNGSDPVKIWIKRLKEVLYDADDLFDEVATDDLLKQQMMKGNNKLSWKNKVKSIPLCPLLEELSFYGCPELESWESQDKRGMDWDSLSNLRFLDTYPLPPPEKLPDCLRRRQSLGQLKITEARHLYKKWLLAISISTGVIPERAPIN